MSFLFGAAGLREFEDAIVHDPAVVALRVRTRAVLDRNSPRGAATATVRTVDGRTLSTTVTHAKGSTELPLTDAEIEAKVRDLASHGGFSGSIDGVISAIWRLDVSPTIARLLEAVRP